MIFGGGIEGSGSVFPWRREAEFTGDLVQFVDAGVGFALVIACGGMDVDGFKLQRGIDAGGTADDFMILGAEAPGSIRAVDDRQFAEVFILGPVAVDGERDDLPRAGNPVAVLLDGFRPGVVGRDGARRAGKYDECE